MPDAKRNDPGGVDLTKTIRFVYEMRSSIQQNQSRSQGQAESSVRCPVAIQRVRLTSQPNAAPVVWCNNPHEFGDNRPSAGGGSKGDALLPRPGYKIRPAQCLSAPIQCVNLMDTAEEFSLGPICSYRKIPCAGSHSTPEGWVRPQGVGPRVPHHTYVRTEESLKAQGADPDLIQSFSMSENE